MKTLKNAASALAIISESTSPVPVSEIASRLGLARSSASRLMTSLRNGGLIEQDPETRRYGPGLLSWQMGTQYRPMGYDMALLSEAISSLSQLTGFTCWISVLDRCDIILLRQHQGRVPVQFSLRLGQRLPAHATAVGKALLSRLSDDAATELLSDNLIQVTSNTIVSRAMLLAEFRSIREKGYALARQEAFPGVIAVGGTVFGAACNCPIGLSISFPARLAEHGDVALRLRKELQRIGMSLGDPYWLSDVAPSQV